MKIKEAIDAKGQANVVFATGTSQLLFLEALVAKEEIDWKNVVAFHLDEYCGLAPDHPASFRHYLNEHLVKLVPLKAFHGVQAEDPARAGEECARLGKLLAEHPIDVGFVGIGENGHLAFNDPPANLDAGEAFLVVTLTDSCVAQQLGEGWFKTKEEVPKQAISMSMQGIAKCKKLVCVVPEKRKAEAVRNATEGTFGPGNPAAMLQHHPDAVLYLDKESSSLLKSEKPEIKAPAAAAPAAGRGFVIRTFRPGQGWVEVDMGVQRERGIVQGKLSPMDQRRKIMQQKRMAAMQQQQKK